MNTFSFRRLAPCSGGLVIALGLCSAVSWAQAPASAAPPPARPRAAAPAASIEPRVDTSAAPAAVAAPSAGAAKPAAARRASDRVDLEASQITGNRELPRVLYIVPWRAPAAGDLEGRPVNSLLYELTKPVDREVFRRENRYFDALEASGAAAGQAPAATPTPGGPEK